MPRFYFRENSDHRQEAQGPVERAFIGPGLGRQFDDTPWSIFQKVSDSQLRDHPQGRGYDVAGGKLKQMRCRIRL